MKLLIKVLLLVALMQLVMCTDHVYKLGNDDGEDGEDATAEDGAAGEDGEDADDLTTVEATVGDTVVLDLPQDKPEGENAGVIEWVHLESRLGKESDVYAIASESFVVNDDESRTFSFGIKAIAEGEDVLSFVNGDISKLDDAIDGYNASDDQEFSVADMNGLAYA